MIIHDLAFPSHLNFDCGIINDHNDVPTYIKGEKLNIQDLGMEEQSFMEMLIVKEEGEVYSDDDYSPFDVVEEGEEESERGEEDGAIGHMYLKYTAKKNSYDLEAQNQLFGYLKELGYMIPLLEMKGEDIQYFGHSCQSNIHSILLNEKIPWVAILSSSYDSGSIILEIFSCKTLFSKRIERSVLEIRHLSHTKCKI